MKKRKPVSALRKRRVPADQSDGCGSSYQKARARYDKYKGSGLKWERDAIIDLQKMVGRLWEEFPKLIQQLNEYGDQNLIETTRKLYGVLKRYELSWNPKLCRPLRRAENV